MLLCLQWYVNNNFTVGCLEGCDRFREDLNKLIQINKRGGGLLGTAVTISWDRANEGLILSPKALAENIVEELWHYTKQ